MTEHPPEDSTREHEDAVGEPSTTVPTASRSVTGRARRIGGAASAVTRSRPTPGNRTSRAAQVEDEQVEQAMAARRVAGARRHPRGASDAAGAGDAPVMDRTGSPTGTATLTDETAPAATDSESGERTERRAAAWSRRGQLLVVLGAAVAAALLVLDLAVLSHRVLGAKTLWLVGTASPSSSEVRDQLMSTVKSDVATVISYDYRHLDQDEKAASALTTGQYQRDYVTTMDRLIKPQAPTQKAVVAGQVGKAGLMSMTANGQQAQVLVYAQQTVTNVSLSQPRQDVVSLIVTLDKVDGHWLISAMRQA